MILRNVKYIISVVVLAAVIIGFGICNNNINNSYDLSYTKQIKADQSYHSKELNFNFDKAVCHRDENINSQYFDDAYYALFINDTTDEVIVSKNALLRMYPASMTKLVTASVVCKHIEAGDFSLDDMVTIDNLYDLRSIDGGINAFAIGDTISVRSLLYSLMIQSNNYYALYLAEYTSGSVEAFVEEMNNYVQEIGATNTHFANPHGLDDPNHYSTAYDMYLIMKEAYKHDIINDADSYESYDYTYYLSNGVAIDCAASTTNLFINGNAILPSGYSICAWKTGTTGYAGNALALYLTDGEDYYFAVIACEESKSVLYDAMVRMLCFN